MRRQRGGAVGIANELTPIGEDYVNGALHLESFSGEIPVLVISLFNGIGGAFRAYDILGVRPRGLISFDLHGPRKSSHEPGLATCRNSS